MSWTIGLKNYLLIQLPVIWVASTVGVWLFYVQHQFEGVYWERAQEWDFLKAGLEGSSFYQLPKVLQWFSGSIGFHHIHHLSPRIPNYMLEKCHRENPIFHVKPVKLWSSLKSLSFRLWDEKKHQLVNFKYLKIYQIESSKAGWYRKNNRHLLVAVILIFLLSLLGWALKLNGGIRIIALAFRQLIGPGHFQNKRAISLNWAGSTFSQVGGSFDPAFPYPKLHHFFRPSRGDIQLPG